MSFFIRSLFPLKERKKLIEKRMGILVNSSFSLYSVYHELSINRIWHHIHHCKPSVGSTTIHSSNATTGRDWEQYSRPGGSMLIHIFDINCIKHILYVSQNMYRICAIKFFRRITYKNNPTEVAILGWYIYKRSSDKLLRRIHLKQHSLKALHGRFELQELHQSNWKLCWGFKGMLNNWYYFEFVT